jgi:large subunit ribosomal protein L18
MIASGEASMAKKDRKKSHPRFRARARRKRHIRLTVSGTPERPRLSVYRSNRHIYAQVIDDTKGQTLAAASTLSPEIREQVAEGDKRHGAKLVGQVIAKRCLDLDIAQIVFDRGGNLYKGGRIKALAEAAREAGLQF